MNTIRVQQSGQSEAHLASGATGRLVQVRAYQQLARVRLKEKLSGSPTGAMLYDLLMRDQLAFIKLSAPTRHA